MVVGRGQRAGLPDSPGLVGTSPARLPTRHYKSHQRHGRTPGLVKFFKEIKILIFKNNTSPRVRVQFLLPMPYDLWHGYRTCGNESGGVRESGAGPNVQIPKSTSPRVRWPICIANVCNIARFRPDLWPDSLTSPGVHKSGDPTLARLLAGDPVGVGWLAKEEGEDQE